MPVNVDRCAVCHKLDGLCYIDGKGYCKRCWDALRFNYKDMDHIAANKSHFEALGMDY